MSVARAIVLFMTNHYGAETIKRLFAVVAKFTEAINAPMKDFSHAAMREVRQEILDALPDIKRCYFMDENSPDDTDDDAQFFDDVIYSDGNDIVWSFLVTVDFISGEDINPISFAYSANSAYRYANSLISWLNNEVRV